LRRWFRTTPEKHLGRLGLRERKMRTLEARAVARVRGGGPDAGHESASTRLPARARRPGARGKNADGSRDPGGPYPRPADRASKARGANAHGKCETWHALRGASRCTPVGARPRSRRGTSIASPPPPDVWDRARPRTGGRHRPPPWPFRYPDRLDAMERA
jgi:hypothetical protein